MKIEHEAPRAMHARHEVSVLRAAVRHGGTSPRIRFRLAELLNQLDAFAETIELIANAPEAVLGYDEQMVLAAAYFARAEPGDTALALEATHAASSLAATEAQAAVALAGQARAYLRINQPAIAEKLLRLALERDPTNRDACRRLTAELLSRGDASAALAVTDDLISRGVGHATLLATRTTVLAKLGDIDGARALLDLDRFLWEGTIETPTGWDSLASFNAALGQELLSHSSLRYGRHGTASVDTWRIDSLVAGDVPIARMLIEQILVTMHRHVATLGGFDHPWIKARPDHAIMRSWCVMTESSGFETWHMHPFGWMSGVYYVAVPQPLEQSSSDGCLMLGLWDGFIGEDVAANVGRRQVHPQAGKIALFPSHSYHRTFPHGASGKRICVAFDVEAL